MKALVVDDDLALADVIAYTLRRAGYEVILAHDGQTALERWAQDDPDLVILDWNLPRKNGLEVCRAIRNSDDPEKADTPIILLTVRSDEDDIVKGLKLGADDYIVKPFSPRQLAARAEAVLRRAGLSGTPAPLVNSGSLSLDTLRLEVRREGYAVVRLTQLESKLLYMLLRHPGQVLVYDFLIDSIWGAGRGDKSMLKQLIFRLRRKIEQDLQLVDLIKVIPGIGYAFHPDSL